MAVLPACRSLSPCTQHAWRAALHVGLSAVFTPQLQVINTWAGVAHGCWSKDARVRWPAAFELPHCACMFSIQPTVRDFKGLLLFMRVCVCLQLCPEHGARCLLIFECCRCKRG